MNSDKLREAIADLYRIEQAGELSDLSKEIADSLRGWPANPVNALTIGERLTAERLAHEAARLLRVPLDETLPVAMGLFAPSREQVVCGVIHGYAVRLNGTTRPSESQPETKPQPSRAVVVSVRRRGGVKV